MVYIRYILLLGLIFSLFVPVSATDLTGYDGYITPKFGASVYGQYWYKADFVKWYWATPSFENNEGYYDIYKDSETVDFQITLNTTYSGELYLVLFYENKEGNYEYSDYLVHSGGSGDYSHIRYSKEIEIPSNVYGDCYFQFVLSAGYWIGGSSNKWSKEYTFFTKRGLNTNWKQKRLISVSSTEKMKDGITQLNLNESYMQDMNIQYTLDSSGGSLYSYSGTLTDLVFTNEDYTKAYPYFVNKYNGGYYEFNRNLTNDTTIDLWINEDTNAKSLYMFYDYTFGATSSYIYGSAVGYQHDRPNNPFTVHQVFNDLRWNETQMKNNIMNLSFSPHYNYWFYRGSEIKFTLGSSYWMGSSLTMNNLIYNRINNLEIKDRSQQHGNSATHQYYSYNNSHILFYKKSDTEKRLYNSSNNYNSGATYTGIETNIINLKNNNLSLTGNLNLNISENLSYFTLEKITFNLGSSPAYPYSYLYYYQELPNNTITYSVSNASATDYAYINFLDMLEYETFLNDLWIGGYIEIDSSGLFLCQDSESNILGSVNIVKDETLESFNIVFPYTITNQTKFLNISEFNYSCSFISALGGFEVDSENLTINFTTNRIFLDTIKPIHQNNYSSEYVNYNINSELNYTGVQTDFSLTTNKIQCLKVSDDQCIKYNYLSGFNNYNVSNISVNYNYNNIYQMDVNNWYQQYYKFYRDGVYLSTPSRLFYVYKTEELISFPVEDFLDWNDTDITDNKEFMSDKFWENPLNWMSSFVYQKFIITQITDEKTLDIFKYTFLIFWSFWFVILMIGLGLVYEFRDNANVLKIAGFGVMPFVFFFSYLDWLGINIISLVVLLICIFIVYLWSKK